MYEELRDEMYEVSFGAQEALLLEKATSGNIDAMFLLAQLYYNDGTMDSAYEWFVKAAEKGHADSIYYVGNYYWNPFGWDVVEPDAEKAIECYLKAAELGSAKSICELGVQYRHGWITADDNKVKAVELFNKAAALEYTEAYYQLAQCYEHGDGVEKDLITALEYYKKAYTALVEQNL